MRNCSLYCFLLLYNILVTLFKFIETSDSRTQAFLHLGELSHLVDNHVFHLQDYFKTEETSAVSFTNLEEDNLNTYASPVSFQPVMLNFNSHSVGMPHMERVTVRNLSPDTSIHMLSISGNTLHFHCSFFQEKVIPPGGNTFFDVVFLARQEGPVENTLFIHTSLGSFKYQVTAVGTANPYRLRPFIGVKMPLNSSYSPVVHMHNPHSSTLKLTEMYTSGGDLHLELLDGDNEASQKIWEIPPYETKPVIKANFIARVEKNHTAFIRIKTNSSHDHNLILPVEVDVTSIPGLYSPTEILDFGILRSHDPPKVLSLSLLNSGQKHIHVMNVIVTPVNEAVDVKFIPTKISPDTVFSTQVATISFNPAKALHSKQCSGKIVVKSKNNQFKLHIPYRVQLIIGSLGFNKSCTKFYIGQDKESIKEDMRELNITNNFNVTIIIYNVSLADDAKPHFRVLMKNPVVLNPGQTSSAVLLTFHPLYKNLQLTTHMKLHTNISSFEIPLLCFSGRLKVFLPHAINESILDFGTLGIGDKRTIIFAVINENPVDVNLKLWGSNISKTYVELVGIDKGNASTLAWKQNFSAMAHSLILKPQHYAILRIGVTAPAYEGVLNGQAFVETQYEKIRVPFSLRTAKGGLKVPDIYFGHTFPGKIATLNLYVHSTFSHPMTVSKVTAVPEDVRFSFDTLKHTPSILHPNSKNLIGKVHFDLRKQCKNKCYSGLPTTTSMGHQWLLGMSLPPDVADMDKELFKTLHNRWKRILEMEGISVNLSVCLDTTEVRGHILKAETILHWPRLFTKPSLKFPITQIGNRTIKDFILENPSSLPLIVQIVSLSLYPKPHEISSLLFENIIEKKNINLKHITLNHIVFALEDLEEYNPFPDNHIPAYRKSVEEYFGVQSHKQSIAILLTPGMRVRIRVGFTPIDESLQTSLILIRNNLTVLDALLVQGQGGYGEIKFGNISPDSDVALHFDLTDKHLKDCEGLKTSRIQLPNFTVRKPFTARNTGALPVYIKGFDINGKHCKAYGFRVLNCEGFELKPNESKRIDIVFTPDFTLTRVERILNIHTSQGFSGRVLKFLLVATIPRHMLSFCSEAQPRPFWEPVVYYFFNSLTTILVFGLLLFAHLDSRKILRTSFFPVAITAVSNERIDKGNIFDLKALTPPSTEVTGFSNSHHYKSIETKKVKDVEQKVTSSENSISSSHKKSISFKNKDLLHVKEYDDSFYDNNLKHSKKKTLKVKSYQENQSSDTNLIDNKKAQPRNSWTRFLKPSFSFNSNINSVKKPSVATQTGIEEFESSIKNINLETILSDATDNDISCERITNKIRQKKHTKNHFRKCMDNNLLELETSSTTTETSTTESDISEKDHHLPDVCVTSKLSKIRFSKNKLNDKMPGTNFFSANKPLKKSSVDGEGFELSSKSRGHKKVKVDSKEIFGGDILCPSSLELPYKPTPINSESKKSSLSTSDDSLASFQSNPSYKCKDDLLNCFSHQSGNFFLPQNLQRNFWSGDAVDDNSSYFARSTLPTYPASYSAALSRDIPLKSSDITPNEKNCTSNNKNIFNQQKLFNSYPPETCNYVGHLSSENLQSSLSPLSLYSTQPITDIPGSRLKYWVGQSKPEIIPSVSDVQYSPLGTDIPSQKTSNLNSSCDTFFSNTDAAVQNNKFLAVLHALRAEQRQELEVFKKQFVMHEDHPVLDVPRIDTAAIDNNFASVNLWMKDDFENNYSSQSENISDLWNNSLASYWGNTSKVWSPPSRDNTVSPVVLSSSEDGPICSSASSSDIKTSKTNGEFDPFHSLSNLWIGHLNSGETATSDEASANNSTFSLFSEPGISDKSQISSNEKEKCE